MKKKKSSEQYLEKLLHNDYFSTVFSSVYSIEGGKYLTLCVFSV